MCSDADILSVVLPWLPLMATVAGWWVVNRQNNAREQRKEERAMIDAAKKLTIEAAAKARSVMFACARDETAELDLKALLDQLEIELTRVPGYAGNKRLIAGMAGLADAATAGSFESAQWRQRTGADQEPQMLIAARNTLLTELEKDFARRYLSRRTFWQGWRQQDK